MFYQVCVPPLQRSFLRFLWWPEGDLDKEVMEYQMCVHIFGAKSSPSVANFVVRRIGSLANDKLVSETLRDNFYVDDCLKSVQSPAIAENLITNLRHEFAGNGFHLTKFVSNDRNVIASLPPAERAADIRNVDIFNVERFPTARALGVVWNIETDTFGFKVDIRDRPFTRRGLLAVTDQTDPYRPRNKTRAIALALDSSRKTAEP